MSLITPAQLRAFMPTTLDDPSLQLIIDGNESYMATRLPIGARTILRFDQRPSLMLYLDPPALSVALIRERYQDYVNLTYIDLDTTDYLIHDSGRRIERLLTGTHPADSWSERVEITYTPADDSPLRKLALVGLCKLDIKHNPGVQAFHIGQHQEVFAKVDYIDEKESILSELLASSEAMA